MRAGWRVNKISSRRTITKVTNQPGDEDGDDDGVDKDVDGEAVMYLTPHYRLDHLYQAASLWNVQTHQQEWGAQQKMKCPSGKDFLLFFQQTVGLYLMEQTNRLRIFPN